MELKNTAYEVEQRVATIWLDRPHRMNAWTGRLHTEYRYLLQQANDDTEVGAIVVTGRGRGFCVGGDSEALTGHSKRGSYDAGTPQDIAKPGYGVNANFDAAFAYHFGLFKPVIAAVNGPAAGVGLALACFADIRFAVPGIKFTTAHGKLNLPAEYGLSWMLPRIVGLGRANDLLLTSRVFYSEEAERIGGGTGRRLLEHKEAALAQREPLALHTLADEIGRGGVGKGEVGALPDCAGRLDGMRCAKICEMVSHAALLDSGIPHWPLASAAPGQSPAVHCQSCAGVWSWS